MPALEQTREQQMVEKTHYGFCGGCGGTGQVGNFTQEVCDDCDGSGIGLTEKY